jgi:phage terminase Nu1 subunit (DNA packaging protein)
VKSGNGGSGWLRKLNQQDAAYILGVTSRSLRDWADAPRNDDGTYDAQALVRWRTEKLEGSGTLDLNAERARLAKWQADKTEQDVELRAGRMLDAEAVQQWVAGMIATARQRLVQLPETVRQIAPPEHGERITREVRRLVHEALAELAASRGDAPVADVPALGAPADADGDGMGGPVPKAVKRKQRRARAVAD